GMKPPDQNVIFVATGVYQEVTQPAKLVYTWSWEPTLQADTGEPSPDAEPMMDQHETLVTVEFHDRSGATELILTHENFPSQEARDAHNQGWTGVLAQLEQALQGG
ncbi:MAG: SRPBCC domain-containing protein, partial [Dehalococcoidia bacterium]